VRACDSRFALCGLEKQISPSFPTHPADLNNNSTLNPPPFPQNNTQHQNQQSTPLDETSVTIDSDFMPIVKEVLGRRMPEVMQRAADLAKRSEEQQQQDAAAAAAAADSSSSSSSSGAAVVQPLDTSDMSLEERQLLELRREGLEVRRGVEEAADRAAAAAPGNNIKLDDDTLRMVARAVMGRLDVVDLVGRNTAEELAERVRGGPCWVGGCLALAHVELRQQRHR